MDLSAIHAEFHYLNRILPSRLYQRTGRLAQSNITQFLRYDSLPPTPVLPATFLQTVFPKTHVQALQSSQVVHEKRSPAQCWTS